MFANQIYNIGVQLFGLALFLASFFSKKAKLFVKGRKGWRKKIANKLSHVHKRKIWIHAASVGEFEQSRVLIEKIKHQHPGIYVVLTFFSPSGYEMRKNYPYADMIAYLPLDSKDNAVDFVKLIQPDLAIFTKYEFWHNYIREMYKAKIPVLSVSSIFRDEQVYFRNRNGFSAKILKRIDYFFVQDEHSKELLTRLNINKVSVNGDTRFDRVHQIAKRSKENPLVASFTNGYKTIICGSVWKEDMEVLLPLINRQDEKIRFIIVPHEIKQEEIEIYRNKINFKSSLYSENNAADSKVLFIDEMGLLASMYKYGDLAFVGGAYGSGLHNILEPASFGLPVFFGNKNYKKFNEATRMLKMGTAFTISGTAELIELTDFFLYDDAKLKDIQNKINEFVNENIGATDRVFHFIEKNYLNI